MKIEILPHDEAHKRRLFCLIGEHCASTDVREKLGGPISSDENHTWFVAVQDDEAHGFVAVVPHKNGSDHMKHLHLTHVKGGPAMEGQLIRACIKWAKNQGLSRLMTTDWDKRTKVYETRGWTPGTKKGRFRTYIKELL